MLIIEQIWAQLCLQPSVATDPTGQGNKLLIHVDHRDSRDSSEEPRKHRILSDVPSADVQPPDRIAKFELSGVRFSMDILESKQRPSLKRSRTSPIANQQLRREGETGFEGDSENTLSDMISSTDTSHFGENGKTTSPHTSSQDRKRRRTGAHAPIRTVSSPVLPSMRSPSARRRSLAIVTSDNMHSTSPSNELNEVCTMVDGAMRLSIYGLNKASNGLKIKANTFGVGLADVVPNLWRPGYLIVGEVRRISSGRLTLPGTVAARSSLINYRTIH